MQTVKKWLGWMMMLSLLSLTGCTIFERRSAGNFCDVYTVVDLPRSEAEKLERRYRDRILANELHQFQRCSAR